LAYARLGLAISRSRTRNTAERNRIKRIVRESFRRHQRDLSGFDLVVTARKPLTRIASRHIAEALAGHWHRLGAHGPENMNNDSDRKA
jgi:ribonuclease P protein component